MTYQPLHHKYRPQIFSDLVGQEAIASTLTNAINREKIAPAYLFTGPRGTGKTSSARILAKSLNCLNSAKPTPNPCGECEVCKAIARGSALDVVEIDAASNTGVDNIREIIERAQFAPVQCRYKVYVIDECHMLSTAAFNALLKTLEEPPKQVIFVLATTDPQRVLPTIISRCQRFDYRRIPLEATVKHLNYIATQEQIEIEPEALTLVAQIASGGLRDAESLLDQLSLLTGKVTPARVWELVGSVPEKDLLSLLQAIHSDDSERVLDECRHLTNRGREPLVVLQNLAGFYLNLLIAKTAPNRSDLVAVTSATWEALSQEAKQWQIQEILRGQQHLKDSEVQIKNTTQPRLWLEVTLLGLLPSALSIQADSADSTPDPPPPTSRPQTPLPAESQLAPPPPAQQPAAQPITPTPAAPTTNATTSEVPRDLEQIWQDLIKHLQHNSTQQLLLQHGNLIRLAEPSANIGCKAQGLLNLFISKRPEIEAAFQSLYGKRITVNIELISHSTSNEPTSINSDNGHRPQLLVAVNPEINGKHADIPAPVAPENPLPQHSTHEFNQVIAEPPEISREKEAQLNVEYAEEDLHRVVENFSRAFEGIIVTDNFEVDREIDEQETAENNTESPQIEANPNQEELEKISSEPPKITGRPAPEELDENDF